MCKFLKWTPRILAIIFAAFISIFALDVLGEQGTFLYKLIGLFMHLIPTFAIIILLVIAWKHKFIGGILFIILGMFFTIFFHTYEDVIVFIIISMPLLIIGILFLLSNHFEKSR